MVDAVDVIFNNLSTDLSSEEVQSALVEILNRYTSFVNIINATLVNTQSVVKANGVPTLNAPRNTQYIDKLTGLRYEQTSATTTSPVWKTIEDNAATLLDLTLIPFDPTGTDLISTNLNDVLFEIHEITQSLTAEEISFESTGSGLVSNDIQSAILELKTIMDNWFNEDNQTAAEVPFDNGGTGLSATNLQIAIEQLKSLIDNVAGTDDQTASEVPFDNAGTDLTAEDVQAAIIELKDALDNFSTSADGITFDNAGTDLTAEDVQAALVEIVSLLGDTLGEHDATGDPAAPSEGVYRITGDGKVGGIDFNVDDILRIYPDDTVYKYGRGITKFDYTPTLGDTPVAAAPASSDGTENLTDDVWTSDFQGTASTATQYTATDFVWDKSSSIRVSLEQVATIVSGYVEFIAFTTHPANLIADLTDLFSSSFPLSSDTDAIILLSAGDTGGGFAPFVFVIRAGDTNPIQYMSVAGATNAASAVHEFYLGVNGTGVQVGVKSGATEETITVNSTQDFSGIGDMTMMVASTSIADAVPTSTSFIVNYTAGSSTGTALTGAFSSGSFGTLANAIYPDLVSGVYESKIDQNISGVELSTGDIFVIGIDNTTVTNLSIVPSSSSAADHILYTPNALDTLGDYGDVDENDSPYLANSFEEAVNKSKAAGRLPIVIDSDVFGLAGDDTIYPRIKSFNVGSISYYDLTNITVYSRDAWINKSTALLKTLDLTEQTIIVDQGVSLRYSAEAGILSTNYQDDYIFGGGRQLHGFIGFGQFNNTNSRLTTELPDPLNHTQVESFFELYSNTTSLPSNQWNTFVLWSDSIDDTTVSPTDPDHVYSDYFIKVVTAEISAFAHSSVYIDIRANDINYTTMPVVIDNGLLDTSGRLTVHFTVQIHSNGSIFEGTNTFEGENNSGIDSGTYLIFALNVLETDDFDLVFEPLGNTVICIEAVDSDVAAWASIDKIGDGRLHIYNVTGATQTLTVNSDCARSSSGVTWSSIIGAAITVNHTDTIKTYAIPDNLPVVNVIASGIVNGGYEYSNASNDGTQANAKLITTNIHVVDVLSDASSAVKLPDEPLGKTIKVFNMDSTYALIVFPFETHDLGAGVDTSESLATGTWAEYTGLLAGRWKKTNSGSI